MTLKPPFFISFLLSTRAAEWVLDSGAMHDSRSWLPHFVSDRIAQIQLDLAFRRREVGWGGWLWKVLQQHPSLDTDLNRSRIIELELLGLANAGPSEYRGPQQEQGWIDLLARAHAIPADEVRDRTVNQLLLLAYSSLLGRGIDVTALEHRWWTDDTFVDQLLTHEPENSAALRLALQRDLPQERITAIMQEQIRLIIHAYATTLRQKEKNAPLAKRWALETIKRIHAEHEDITGRQVDAETILTYMLAEQLYELAFVWAQQKIGPSAAARVRAAQHAGCPSSAA